MRILTSCLLALSLIIGCQTQNEEVFAPARGKLAKDGTIIAPDLGIIADSSWLPYGEIGVRASYNIVHINGKRNLSWLCPIDNHANVPLGANPCDYDLAYNGDSTLPGLVQSVMISYKDSFVTTLKDQYAVGKTYSQIGADTACIESLEVKGWDGIPPKSLDEYYTRGKCDTSDGIVDGDYLHSLTVNYKGQFPEQNFNDNTVISPITIFGDIVYVNYSFWHGPDTPQNFGVFRKGPQLTFSWSDVALTKYYELQFVYGGDTTNQRTYSLSLSGKIPPKKGSVARVRAVNNFGVGNYTDWIPVK